MLEFTNLGGGANTKYVTTDETNVVIDPQFSGTEIGGITKKITSPRDERLYVGMPPSSQELTDLIKPGTIICIIKVDDGHHAIDTSPMTVVAVSVLPEAEYSSLIEQFETNIASYTTKKDQLVAAVAEAQRALEALRHPTFQDILRAHFSK